jgi:non-specific serine/threonine protein kinase/serine/threonine-protein kinase
MDTAQVLARFDAERQALAVMDHPAIAKIFEGGRTPEGRPYFAMEYVRGEAITRYCDSQRLAVPDRLKLFIQLCDGVQHAHQKGIIHRDLKPSNVMVSTVNDRPVPHIIDFGIAKAVAQPLTDQLLYTGIGGFVGTLEYMSPEQAQLSSADVDTRSDVYSLGVLLYELLTGALPFDSRTLREVGIDEARRTIRETEPPTPSTRIVARDPKSGTTAERRRTEPAKLASLLEGDLDWITMRALEKDRTQRYQTVNALAMDLARHLNDEPVLAGPPSAAYRARKFVRRHRVGVAAAALVLVLLTGFAVVTAVQAGRIARERDRANQEAATAQRVSDFLVGLFRVSDPSETRGRTVTAREILDNGAREIETLADEPDVQARLQATIGSVYTTLGDYAAALPHLEKAVATRRRLLGADHPDTLAAVNSLATAYWYLDRFGEAETLFRDVAERHARLRGAEHRDTLKAEYDLASVYARQTRWVEAEALQRRVLAAQQRVLGSDHADTLASLNNLHAYLQGQKQYAEAARIGVDLVESRRRVLGADHPSTLLSIGNLAVSYEYLGDIDTADAMYREALTGMRRVLGDRHRTTARTSLNMANMLIKQRRYADAEPLAIAAHTVFRAVLGDENASTKSARSRLVELYEGWGRVDEAARWRTAP